MTKFLPTLLLICLCAVIASSIQAQTPGYNWIKPANGTGSDAARDVVISKDNYLYTCGNFSSPTLQLGAISLTNAGSNDIYVAKYDTAGTIIWAKKYGSTGSDVVQSITTDSLNNVYITGSCTGAVSFGALNFTGGNYVLKLSNLGNEVWVINPATNATISDIAADPAGKTVVCGYFNAGAVTIGTQSVTTTASDDGFIAAFDANGNFSWYRQVYSTKTSGSNYNLSDKCFTVTVSASGLIAIGGEFDGNDKLFFSSNTVSDSAATNMVTDPQRGNCPVAGYAAALNMSNVFLWAKDNISSINSGRYWSTVHHIAVTPGNEVYVSATNLSRSSTTSFDISLIVKYNSNGVIQWSAGPPSQFLNYIGIGNRQPALAVDNNLVYITEKELSSVANNANESRIHCYNGNGVLQWSSAYTGNAFGPVSLSSLTALAASKNVYATGTLLSTNFANLTTTYSGNGDGYLAKLDYYVAPLLPLVIAPSPPDQAICAGGSVQLAAGVAVSGGLWPYTYNWTPNAAVNNATLLNPTASPTVSTNYILTVTDAAGNTKKDTVLVTVRAPLTKPSIQFVLGAPYPQSSVDTLVCVSSETNVNYQWRKQDGSIVGSAAKLLVQKGSWGKYTVTISTTTTGCASNTSDLFYHNVLEANAGPDTAICAGQSIALGTTPAYFGQPSGPLNYYWQQNDGFGFYTFDLTAHPVVTPTINRTYVLTVSDLSTKYFLPDTVRVTVVAAPNIGADTLLYHNCYLETTNLLPLYNTTGLTALWNTGTPTVAPPGNYRLIASNVTGCADTAFVTIKLEVATWTGTISNNWHTAGNWNINKVPTSLTHVIINSGTPNNCVISTANATAASVQLRNGAVLSTSNGMTITVTGNCAVLPPN
jgi:Beta-propeller repeat